MKDSTSLRDPPEPQRRRSPGPPDPEAALAGFLARAAHTGLACAQRPVARSTQGSAAVLFADIAGFTALAEAVCRDGSQGVERLSEILDACFGELIELVQRFRGDVVSFHGDALLAHWPVDGSAEFGAATLALATHHAARCAAAIQHAMHRRSLGRDITVSLRIAVGAGPVCAFHVGSDGDRWTYFIAGEAVLQLRDAQRLAAPGDVVLSAAAARAAAQTVICARLDGGSMRLVDVAPLDPAAGVPAAPWPASDSPAMAWREYVPAVVRARVLAGQLEWIAELRRVSVVFLRIHGIDHAQPAAGAAIQQLTQGIQADLRHLQGYFHQLLVDDKGTVLIAAFGLPPFAHEDDPARALRFAFLARRTIAGLELGCDVGLAQGRVFAGPLGSSTRRDYALIGDTMNLCARLMEAADGRILCDEAIERAGAGCARFALQDAFALKGRRAALRVFEVTEPEAGDRTAANRAPDPAALYGRDEEFDALRARIHRLLAERRADALMLEGEPGLGKTHLLAAVANSARELGLPVLWVEGDAIERATPYRAWRAAFLGLALGGQGAGGAEQALRRLGGLLGDEPDLLALLPLAAAVLPFDLPGNELCDSLHGEVRAANTRRLLAELLLRALGEGGGVLLIEDAHWFDSGSLALLREILGRPAPVLTLISRRPREGADDLIDDIAAQCRIDRLHLRPLDITATAVLLQARLGAGLLPPDLAAAIHGRSGGNPYYSEQLLLALQEAGALAADGAPDWQQVLERALPGSIQDIVTHRIDRLDAGQQIGIKVASVIGRIFGFGLLRQVHPLQPLDTALRDDLDALVHADLTQRLREAPEAEWTFRHAITQDAAYGLLLFAQRRELHRSVAERLEAGSAAARARQLPLLAHHWSRAEQWVRAVDCWEEAGVQALESGAPREARRQIELAIAQSRTGGLQIDALRRAGWECRLAEACLQLGLVGQSRDHAARAMQLLGQPVPAGTPGLLRALGGGLLRQLVHRLRPTMAALEAGQVQRVRELALANECFSQACYFTGEVNLGLVSILRHLNFAERLGPSPTLARAYGLSSTSAGIFGLHGLARKYRSHALETLEAVHSPLDLGLLHVYFCLNEGGSANWAEMLRLAEDGMDIAGRCGDRRRLFELRSLHSMAQFYSGALGPAARERAQWHAAVATGEDRQLRCWALIERAEVALRQGSLPLALDFQAEAVELLAACGRTERVWLRGVQAATQWRCERPDEALAAARLALDASSEGATVGFYALEGLAGAAETFIELAAARPADPVLRRDARRALRGLAIFALSFPMARPRAALLRGRHAALGGRQRAARRAYARALVEGQRRGMPFEAGLAHLDIAAVCIAGVRRAHLHSALALLEPLGAQREIARARAALQGNEPG